MKQDKLINCPICASRESNNLLHLNCGNLDNSYLYQSVKIDVCAKCGHIYNRLSFAEIRGLRKYYNEEYAPLNLDSADKVGDRPGSNNTFTLKRYAHLYNLISPYINKNSRILDVGCAMGGFLGYLRKRGLNKIYGIDIVEDYVRSAKKNGNYNIKLGSAEDIPFKDKSMDLLLMDQVIEHSVEPVKVFREAKRVLTDNGLLCLGVPDAAKYSKIYFFDFYWFLMREHIQHFDIEHLKFLATSEGFKLVAFSESKTPMVSEKMILPNLNVVFRLIARKRELKITQNCFELKRKTERYITDNFKKLNQKRKIIDDLAVSQKPLYVWGVGREFLYLYESAGLKNCNIIGLIDSNFRKQKKFTVEGKKITDKSILKKAVPGSVLIISAIAHIKQIKEAILKIDYRGEILEI